MSLQIELLTLQADVAKHTATFLTLLKNQIEVKSTGANYDFEPLQKELETASPEGIALSLAKEKLNKFRTENNI